MRKWVSWCPIAIPPTHWSEESQAAFTLDTVLEKPRSWGASLVHGTESPDPETRGITYCGVTIPPKNPDEQTYWCSTDEPDSPHQWTDTCKSCVKNAARRSP